MATAVEAHAPGVEGSHGLEGLVQKRDAIVDVQLADSCIQTTKRKKKTMKHREWEEMRLGFELRLPILLRCKPILEEKKK